MEIFPLVACMAATIGLLAIAFDLGHETPTFIRWSLVGTAIIFFGVFLKTLKQPGHYQDHASIGFTCIGILAIALFVYLKVRQHISWTVVRTSSLALLIATIAWVAVVSCGKHPKQVPHTRTDSVYVLPSRQELESQIEYDSLRKLH